MKILYVLILEVLIMYSVFITWMRIIDNKYRTTTYAITLSQNIDQWLVYKNYKKKFNEEINEEINKKKVFIDTNYFIDNLKLKDYSWVKFKFTDEGKKLVKNIRNLHKSASLIWRSNAQKELCAWYIWILSEKLWWVESPYHLWMMNNEKRSPASAWELPTFYSNIWWDVLIDLWDKFSVNKKDYWKKIIKDDFQKFFKTAFLEEALFWDIWFLYKNTKYTSFLNWWSANSHITKNVWISEFEFIVWKDYENKSEIDIISNTLNCSNEVSNDLFSVLNNYKLFLNWKNIVFIDNELFYLNDDNSLWEKVRLKYLDKISYEDITLTHYFWARSNVNWLFDMACSWKFFPINVISINKRLIEKM